jgi:hypothetical protein
MHRTHRRVSRALRLAGGARAGEGAGNMHVELCLGCDDRPTSRHILRTGTDPVEAAAQHTTQLHSHDYRVAASWAGERPSGAAGVHSGYEEAGWRAGGQQQRSTMATTAAERCAETLLTRNMTEAL